MTVVYASKANQSKFKEQQQPDYPYQFRSPTDTGVEHWANEVIVVGPHPDIEERYRGIASVEIVEIKEDESE